MSPATYRVTVVREIGGDSGGPDLYVECDVTVAGELRDADVTPVRWRWCHDGLWHDGEPEEPYWGTGEFESDAIEEVARMLGVEVRW